MSDGLSNIILVDDDEGVLVSLADFLSDEGFQVETYFNPELAIDNIKLNTFVIYIVDLRMPQMSGEEFILQASSLNEKAKFLVYSGSPEYIPPQSLSSIGITADHILKKPVLDMQLLVEKIQQMSLVQ